jgi:hypothetical protein
MSHRSGETEYNTIADLAVALNCGQIHPHRVLIVWQIQSTVGRAVIRPFSGKKVAHIVILNHEPFELSDGFFEFNSNIINFAI